MLISLVAASKNRHIKRGVKEVVKALRKGEKGSVFTPLLDRISLRVNYTESWS